MYPILFTIGTWSLRSYDLFCILGGIVGGVIGFRAALAAGVSERRIVIFYLLLIPLMIAAGLLNGVLFNPNFYTYLGMGRLVLEGGMISYGLILMAFGFTALYDRLLHIPVLPNLDLMARVLAVMLIFFRIGCLLNGCCFGIETDGFGGVVLPNMRGEWEPRYPTQELLILLDLALALGLWLYSRKAPAPGSVAIAFVFWFGLGRLGIDALRELPRVLGPFSVHMLADLVFVLAGVGLWVWRRQKQPKSIGRKP